MLTAFIVLLRSIGLICRGHRAVALENLALRQQLSAVTRPSNARGSARGIDSFGSCWRNLGGTGAAP